MLSPYRVLDLSDERGQLAGATLAALGADVVLVEPSEGSRSRRLPPLAGGAGPSLRHWALNRGKRSVVLDVEGSAEAKATLLGLARHADVLIDTEPGGVLSVAGITHDDLLAANPRLVHATITPFGLDGPKAAWPAADLTVWAASMALLVTGDEDRPPVRMSLPQAFLHASSEAATAIVVALLERATSGRGQRLDVSAQAACLLATQSQVLAAPFGVPEPSRSSGGLWVGPLHLQMAWPCKDGQVGVTFLFGEAIGPFTRRLMQWVHEEGFCDEATRDKPWLEYAARLLDGTEPIDEFTRVKRVLGEFLATKTKAELLDAATSRRLLVAPMATLDDVVASDHLAQRGWWDTVVDPSISAEPFRAPGPFFRSSIAERRNLPPVVSAAAAGVAAEWGRQAIPQVLAATAVASEGSRPLPLTGLKVLDFMWVLAGPTITRVLADYGATVVRVESETRLDTARTVGPFLGGVGSPDRSGVSLNINAGKLGFAVDLAAPEARTVLDDLIHWADVITESFSPDVMRSLGLDHAAVRKINPDIVMLSTPLLGSSGPLAKFAGFGNLAAALGGFVDVTGWPDRPACGPFSAYTDYVAPRFATVSLLAAVDHLRRTGQGQHLEVAQMEACLHFLAPGLLEATVNGAAPSRSGNRDRHEAPHGVYRCAGDDRWVAIACTSDAEWQALCRVLHRPDLDTPELAQPAERHRRSTELDDAITAWTSVLDRDEAMRRCIESGVPAHAVHGSADCLADPQLQHQGHFVQIEHPVVGTVTIESARSHLHSTPAVVERAGPVIGQDVMAVLTDLLGYDDEQVAALFAADVLR